MPALTMPRRVVIVDDSRTIQAMLDNAFSRRADFHVVGFASDASTAAEMVRRLKPDVVTIDLCMPYLDGAALLEMLSDLPKVCKIVVSDTAMSNVRLMAKLVAAGASACIGKSELVNDPAGFFKKINTVVIQVVDRKRNQQTPANVSKSTLSAAASGTDEVIIGGFPVPADERARIDFVFRNGLANGRRERRFDLVTKHVAKVTAFPACLLTVLDRDTQWIKSSYGVDTQSTPRDQAFCNYTISQGGVFSVSNAACDDRFRSNPLVTGSPGIKSYVGHPIFNAQGVAIASLCIIDIRARTVSGLVIDQLVGMAEIVSEMIDPRVVQAA